MNSTQNATLGPGSGGSPFTLNAKDWTDANSLCSLIAASSDQAVQYLATYTPSFADLKKCTLQWHNQTFANVVNTANSIYNYGMNVVQSNYAQLLPVVDNIQSGPTTDVLVQTIDIALKQCIDKATQIINTVSSCVSDISTLVKAVENVQNELRPCTGSDGGISLPMPGGGTMPDPSSAQFAIIVQQLVTTIAQVSATFTALSNRPLSVLETMEGAWDAISSDLQFIKGTAPTDINTVLPILTELSIQEAMDEWKTVATEAQSFVQNAH